MKTASAKAKARSCGSCIKRGMCGTKEIIQGFVMKQWFKFERVDELIAEKEWLAFLGGRCKEYDNGETKAM